MYHKVYICIASFIHLFHVIMSTSSDIDCGDPGIPKYGQRHGSTLSTVYTSEVRYSCRSGYTLQGSDSITCQSNGEWSGSPPQCNGRFIAWNLSRSTFRLLSRNGFWGSDGRGKCALGRCLGPSSQETVSVPLSEHIYSLVFTGRQELYAIILYCNWEFFELECLGEKLLPVD